MKKNTALLVMDVQNAIVGMLGDDNPMLTALAQTIDAARANGIPVMYVVVGFRKGYPEVSPDNQGFSQIKDSGRNMDNKKAYAVHQSVAPQGDEVIVTKRRVSAFTGSDLEVVLRSQQINHLVLTGIATSGVVLSTLREAADKDYKLTVLSDCCADRDEEVHRVLTTKVFPRQAKVITSDEFAAGLQ